MVRKRKVAIAEEEKENESEMHRSSETTANNSALLHGPMYTIMSNVQLNETFHKKYIKEMKQLYAKMDHDAFMFTFIKMIKSAMEGEESNEFAHTSLLFCAKFLSSFDGEETHPLLMQMFNWLLTTISNNPHIRFRLCQFVNMILNALGYEAALDDTICDHILEYMMERLRDVSPNVRVQAILAMQRLQVPDNPDDQVLRAYQFHLCSDPSPRVRQSVITCMGRNYHTIPYILDRLWDNDEKVRRHTYLHMSSYPVRSYKVSQRLTLLEQGLNDRSESVRKVVITVMLKQWIESYQKNFVSLVAALKLDANEEEMERFRKITKQALKEIFKRQSKEDLLACLPIEEDGEFHRCVPHEKLNIEITLYWQCLTEYLMSEMAEELDLIVPELSTFCAYIESFCQTKNHEMDKFEHMEFQYMLLSLMEILYTFDLGDEIGRGNLQKLLMDLLQKFNLDEKVIEVIIRCAENLITDQNARLQYFVEIIRDICNLNAKPNDLIHDRALVEELLANSSDPDLKFKLSELKVKILDLEEQQLDFEKNNDYEKAQHVSELRAAATDEYLNLLKPLLEQHSLEQTLHLTKVVKNETILKSLQIAFYMVVSKNVHSLNPSICKLYKDFICRHIASNQIAIRDWALKCGTAYSMLYEPLAKGVFLELYKQFHKNHNIRIWETSVTCIFELLDRYGMDTFVVQEDQNKTKRSGRQLYNTLEFLDDEDDTQISMSGQDVSIIYTMSHLLDKCDDVCITGAIINGFCRLVLRGYIKSGDIIEKLLLRYFNPTTDSKINQILGVFLENLIQRKKHTLLQPCILPTVATVFSASYDSPLHEIRPETITRFFIDATRQETCSSTGCVHNKLAITFLQEMCNNVNNKELCKLLAKDLTTLELNVTQNEQLKTEMKSMADTLIKSDFDPKTIKLIINFKDMLDGNFNPPPAKNPEDNESDDEADDETATTVVTKQLSKDKNSSELTSKESTVTNLGKVAENDDVEKTLTPDKIAEINTEQQQETSTLVEATANTEETTENPTEVTENTTETTENTLVPSTEAVNTSKNVSPSALAPTTYGRENIANHRYLRKSLNMSRNQSDSESGDGPTRPAKIRIEARIDSDKKSSSGAKQQEEQTAKPINTRARRNLRYGRNNATETVVAAAQTDKAKDTEKAKETEKGKETEKTKETEKAKSPEKQAQQNTTSPKRQKKKETANNKADDVQQKSPIVRKITRTTANTRKMENQKDTLNDKSNANDTAQKSSSEDGDEDEEINDSLEVVTASPTVISPQIRAQRFLRSRAAANATIANRTTGDRSLLKRKLAEMNNTKNISTSSTLTPVRNGRKRVLQNTPQHTASPIRKQMRNDSNSNTQTQIPPATPSMTTSKTATSSDSMGSPSSTKENDGAIRKNSNSTSISLVAADNDVATKDLETTNNKSNNSKTQNNREHSSIRVENKRSKMNTTAPTELSNNASSSSAITTRNAAAKKRHQLRNIMTRRSLSLEHINADIGGSSSSSTTSRSSVSNSRARLLALKAPKGKPRSKTSRIPIRKVTTDKKAPTTISATSTDSSDNAASSSNAEESSTGNSTTSYRSKTTTIMRPNVASSSRSSATTSVSLVRTLNARNIPKRMGTIPTLVRTTRNRK